jgi:hypothetical protein
MWTVFSAQAFHEVDHSFNVFYSSKLLFDDTFVYIAEQTFMWGLFTPFGMFDGLFQVRLTTDIT